MGSDLESPQSNKQEVIILLIHFLIVVENGRDDGVRGEREEREADKLQIDILGSISRIIRQHVRYKIDQRADSSSSMFPLGTVRNFLGDCVLRWSSEFSCWGDHFPLCLTLGGVVIS